MKLEVGKCYSDRSGRKVLVVYQSPGSDVFLGIIQGPEISYWYYKDGGTLSSGLAMTHNLVKVYVEPVVHKRDVVWYKNSEGCVQAAIVKERVSPFNLIKVLHRQTVECTEQVDV